jgi:Flp pilus assembly protein TadB
LGLPRRLEDTLGKLERGDLKVRVRSSETDRLIRKLSGVNLSINYTLLVCTFTLSATILLVSQLYWVALVIALLAVSAAFLLCRQLIKTDRLDRLS